MIARYRLLAERLRTELQNIEHVVERAGHALSRAVQQPQDRDYFLAAAALDLHSFYAGLERLFELIADEIDASKPAGSSWHRDLLTQMAIAIPDVRPAILSEETRLALVDYLEFRHVVRNVYTFNLRPDRVTELARGLRPTFDQAHHDLMAFAQFLDTLSTADQGV
ncbi:MAG TPA: hypothetical protein VIK33_19350 [Anaerolineae bacterium]